MGSQTIGATIYPRPNRATATPSGTYGWTSAPASLGNSVDGDWSNPTASGYKECSSAYEHCYIFYDLGATYTVNLKAKVSMVAESGSMSGRFIYSYDDSTWDLATGWTTAVSIGTSEKDMFFPVTCVRARYVGFSFENNNAGSTIHAKIYHFEAIDEDY